MAGGYEDELYDVLLNIQLIHTVFGKKVLCAKVTLEDQHVTLVLELVELGSLEFLLGFSVAGEVKNKGTFLKD